MPERSRAGRTARSNAMTDLPPPAPTRRTFLKGATALAAAPLARALPTVRQRTGGKKILVLGGTNFLGPAIVEAALQQGHTLTLFNRGKTNPKLFPEVEKLHGQRRRPKKAGDPEQDLKALADRKWDAAIDTSGFFTGEVEDMCKLLQGNVQQYVYVSSLSVYRDLEQNDKPVDEQSALCECADKYTLDMGKELENYGALKRYCEDAAAAAFGKGAVLVRPGYIVGPRDNSDRFSWWPVRLQRGGECLAPGDPDNELQFIDVRDLGQWIVHAVEQGASGAFNAVGFQGRISTAEFLYCGKGTLNHEASFTWVSDAFLVENGVIAWESMPCWTPKAKNGHVSNRKAVAAGMKFRPIAETIRDTAAWAAAERKDAPWKTGLSPEREAELLAKWRARGK
jgi:nucleoside-diphosphate-sugar epimerase